MRIKAAGCTLTIADLREAIDGLADNLPVRLGAYGTCVEVAEASEADGLQLYCYEQNVYPDGGDDCLLCAREVFHVQCLVA